MNFTVQENYVTQFRFLFKKFAFRVNSNFFQSHFLEKGYLLTFIQILASFIYSRLIPYYIAEVVEPG